MIFLKGGIWTASAVHTAVMRNLLSFFLGILSDLLYVFVCSALFLDRAVTFVWDAPLRRRTGAIIHALARSRAASAALIFIPCFLLPFSLLTQKGVLILAGDRPLGFVQDADMLSGTVHEIEASASAASGETYSLPFSLSTRSMRAPLCEFLDENALRTALTEQSGELDTLAVISIDGTRAGVCHNAEEAQTLLDRVKRLYTTQADSSADFVQQVHVDSVVAESRLAGEPQTVFETLSDRLDVRARRSVTYTETIPFGTVTRENDAEYQDYRETVRQGQTGEAVVTAEIQTLDGEENERTIVARTVLRSASDEIIEVGTKNIGIGAGFTVMRAAEMIDAGASADEIEAALCCLVKSTKVFFCLPTLEYLAKGGRIGRVTATVGSLLDVRPIISCNEEGVYYTVQKARGAVRALAAALQNAADYAKGHAYHLAIAHGGVPELAAHVEAQLAGLIHSARSYVRTQVSPALGVHTGPGLIGIGVQRLV